MMLCILLETSTDTRIHWLHYLAVQYNTLHYTKFCCLTLPSIHSYTSIAPPFQRPTNWMYRIEASTGSLLVGETLLYIPLMVGYTPWHPGCTIDWLWHVMAVMVITKVFLHQPRPPCTASHEHFWRPSCWTGSLLLETSGLQWVDWDTTMVNNNGC